MAKERAENESLGGPHEILSTRTVPEKLLKRATKTSRRQLKPEPAGRYRRMRHDEIHYRPRGARLRAQARAGRRDPLNGEIVFAIFKPKNPQRARLFCALTAAVLCKTHQFWSTQMRRPSSLTKKHGAMPRRLRNHFLTDPSASSTISVTSNNSLAAAHKYLKLNFDTRLSRKGDGERLR